VPGNDKYAYDPVSGHITGHVSGCLQSVAPSAPTPAPSPEAAVNVSVSWAELGYSAGEQVHVKDLWSKAETVAADSFTALVQPHEAAIFVFTRK
jgi:hypothetical protein